MVVDFQHVKPGKGRAGVREQQAEEPVMSGKSVDRKPSRGRGGARRGRPQAWTGARCSTSTARATTSLFRRQPRLRPAATFRGDGRRRGDYLLEEPERFRVVGAFNGGASRCTSSCRAAVGVSVRQTRTPACRGDGRPAGPSRPPWRPARADPGSRLVSSKREKDQGWEHAHRPVTSQPGAWELPLRGAGSPGRPCQPRSKAGSGRSTSYTRAEISRVSPCSDLAGRRAAERAGGAARPHSGQGPPVSGLRRRDGARGVRGTRERIGRSCE